MYLFFSARSSRTSSELSFVFIVTASTSPRSSCVRKVENDDGSASSEFEISLEAKNASTITIRIGNAALLKKRLM